MKQKVHYVVWMVAFLFVLTSCAHSYDYLRVTDSGFTTLPVSARALGMGASFVPVADDYSACYYNPAGLTLLTTHQIGSMYTDLYGMRLLGHSFISYAEPDTGMGSGAISWSHLSANLEPEEWSCDVWAYSYANYLFNKERYPLRSWGINAKYIRQITPYEDASGYSFDIGYLSRGEKISLGICIQDIFSRIDWETGHTDTLPLNVMAGISFNMDSLLISLSADSSTTDVPRNLRIGLEWKLGERIFLRGGLVKKFQQDENRIYSAGIGFKTNVGTASYLSFDYAFVTSQDFNETHYFSLSFGF